MPCVALVCGSGDGFGASKHGFVWLESGCLLQRISAGANPTNTFETPLSQIEPGFHKRALDGYLLIPVTCAA